MLGDLNQPAHGHHHPHDGQDTHRHVHGTPSTGDPNSRYCWQIHHPYEDVDGRAAIEVSPWSGLLPRWRFVVPADYEGIVLWGVGAPNAENISFQDVRRPIRHGPVQLTDGPEVEWFGGHNPLSKSLSAYIVIDGDPPHYLAFGQSDDPDEPPSSLEGIYFNAHNPPHQH